MQIEKTKNYDMFVFRQDNRQIDKQHVRRLKESIEARNLLDMRPISVTKEYEILDGQHRLMAAKELGVEIYYKIEEILNSQDMILMNVSKAWSIADFMNYYVSNKFPEYLKLQVLIKEKNISLSNALHITLGRCKCNFDDFKKGKYKYDETMLSKIEELNETTDFIKRINGSNNSTFTKTAKYCKALMVLFSHEGFDYERFKRSLGKHMSRVMIKATYKDYLNLFVDIYNHRNYDRIELDDLV